MNSRRKFLKQAGILSAAVAAAPDSLFARPKHAQIGIQLYTLRDEISKGIETVIAGIAKAGYNYIETFGFSNGKYFGLSVEDFGTLLKKYKLYTVSGHYGIDDLLKNGSFDNLDASIQAAKVLKQKYVTVPYIGDNLRKNAADLENLVSKINLGAKRVAEAGLKMAYHSHSFEFENIDGVMFYERLLKESDAKHLDLELDLYWAVRAKQDPIEWFKKYPGRFKLVHVKDMDKSNYELTTEVGKGSIDFAKIFNEAKLGGIEYYIVEQENFAIPPYESITESAQALRQLLHKK
ncbi:MULTISPECIES: sugar phosphate isomerase/epimerase family protein [Chitinophagaceae]